jgi:hypothetical protein
MFEQLALMVGQTAMVPPRKHDTGGTMINAALSETRSLASGSFATLTSFA